MVEGASVTRAGEDVTASSRCGGTQNGETGIAGLPVGDPSRIPAPRFLLDLVYEQPLVVPQSSQTWQAPFCLTRIEPQLPHWSPV